MTNAPLHKAVISYAELLEKVQGLLVGSAACRNVSIGSLQVLAEPADGANWYVAHMRRSGDDNDLAACRAFIRSDLVRLHVAYDVDLATVPR